MRDFHTDAIEGHGVLLRVEVANKTHETVKMAVHIISEDGDNCKLPVTGFAGQLFRMDTRVLAHLTKIDPTKPWGKL